MRARLAIAVVALGLLALPAMAQNPSRFVLHMNGWSGFGFGYTNSTWGDLGDSYQNLNTDFGVSANGYLYDPRLVDYDVAVAFDRGSFAVDQGSSSTNGLNVNGNLSFLPDRSFPFSVYFSRTNSGYNSDLVTPYNDVQKLWGFRGAIKNLPVGVVNYNFASGETDSTVTGGPTYQDRYRTGDVSLTRNLWGWQLRVGDDYNWSTNNISDFTQSNNTILADASRTFHDRIRLDVNQLYSTYSFQQPGSTQSDNSTMALNANMSWKHTEKLDSYYSFSFAHNAVNELALLTTINNVANPFPFNPLVSDTTTENFGAGASYRMRPNLTLGASFGFSHNSAPEAGSLAPSVLPSVTTGSMNAGGSVSYRRKLWKLMYSTSSVVMLQRFTTLANTNLGSGLGFSFDNGISGGDVRRLHFTASYRYSHRSNPVFFNASTTTDNLATGQVETAFFRFARLQAMADYGTTEIDLFNSNLKLHRASFMVMASRSQLSVFFARNSSSSNDRFFGPDSLLVQQEQQQNSSQQQNLIPPFFNPLVLTEVSSTRMGVVWHPRTNLQVEGRYAKYSDVFLLPQQTAYNYSQIEVLASYKFGRFTMYGGYGHATSLGGLTTTFNQSTNRILFTVRFPFHIM